MTASLEAAFLVELHESGLANDRFEGNGRTSIPSRAPGVTAENSFFGSLEGDDLYTVRYTPGSDVDNVAFNVGDDLGNGATASGVEGGGSGLYRVYATWPWTENVNVAGSKVTIQTATGDVVLDKVVMNIDDPDNPGGNNTWGLLAEIELIEGETYMVTFEANAAGSFVSQRLHGVLWEAQKPDDPNAKLAPRVPFADLTEASETVSEALTITNNGEEQTLDLQSIRIEGPNAARFQLSEFQSVMLAPGETYSTDLTFDPGGRFGQFAASLIIESNDSGNAILSIPLEITLPDPSGLVAHWPMDETEGSQLMDVSGNGYHASLMVESGGTFQLGIEGLAGGTALQLSDGGDQGAGFAEVPAEAGLPPLYSMTVAFWVNVAEADAGTISGFFGKGTLTGDPFALAAGVLNEPFALEYFVAEDPAGGLRSDPVIEPNQTYHIAITHADTNLAEDGADHARLYINGELVSENETPEGYIDDEPSPFRIGSVAAEAGSFGLTGVIDDFQLYQRALTAEEVTELFASPGQTLGGSRPPEPEPEPEEFAVAAFGLEGDGVSLSWAVSPNATYAIEFSPDLTPDSWTTIATGLSADADSLASFVDERTREEAGYYRVRQD